VRLVRAYSQGLGFATPITAGPLLLNSRPFDAKGKTACGGAIDQQIVDFGMRKQFCDSGFKFSVGHVLLGDQTPAARVGLDCAWTPAQFFRESCVFVIAGTGIGVNVNRSRLRLLFDARES